MPRFRNIPGGVEDLDTGIKWKLGADTNRTQPQAEDEVKEMKNYSMPSLSDLQGLNTASVAEMNGCNLAVFVGKRIWSDTSCTAGVTPGFQSIELGNDDEDICEVPNVSTNHRAMGRD